MAFSGPAGVRMADVDGLWRFGRSRCRTTACWRGFSGGGHVAQPTLDLQRASPFVTAAIISHGHRTVTGTVAQRQDGPWPRSSFTSSPIAAMDPVCSSTCRLCVFTTAAMKRKPAAANATTAASRIRVAAVVLENRPTQCIAEAEDCDCPRASLCLRD